MNAARIAVIIVLVVARSTVAHAEDFTGDITAIDSTAITVANSYGAPKSYRLRPSTEVTINGKLERLTALSEGMQAQITSGEPGIATRIMATGTPKTGGAPAPMGATLKQRLIGTRWVWFESKKEFETITFQTNGVADWSLPGQGQFKWEVLPKELRVQVTKPNGNKYTITFDPTLRTGRLHSDKGVSETRRLTK